MSVRQRLRLADRFVAGMRRQHLLFLTTVVAGGTKMRMTGAQNGILGFWGQNEFHGLRQVDKRELVEAIFFEAAARFEEFAFDTFLYSVRKKFKVSAAKADFIMGHPDSGTSRISGWASVDTLKKRGLNCLGTTSFFARLNTRLNARTRRALKLAHLLRNRIAHKGPASGELLKLMQEFGVPKNQMGGITPGRFLLEYPQAVQIQHRMFYILIFAYMRYAYRWAEHA